MGDNAGADPADAAGVTFYWRPGCGFCARLAGELDQLGVDVERRNIWEDADAAAYVRSVAGGNETVPTVVVGPQALVNPRGRDVVAALRRHAPHLVPADVDESA